MSTATNIRFALGEKIRFAEDRKPYTVKAISERFAILTRPVKHKGEKTVLYTIVDIEEMIRGPNDWVLNPYDYKTDEGIAECMTHLNKAEGEEMKAHLSRRHSIPLVLAS